jgi:putative transposase
VSNDTNVAHEPDNHALGRSRGGLTTKIHALADVVCDLAAVRLTAGQAGDNPQLLPLLDDYLASDHTDAGPLDIRLLADKAYSHPSTRRELRRRRVKHTIPERRDQIADRKPKARRAAGHPPSTPRSTSSATPSSEGSTASSNGEAWPPATTNTP